MDQQKRLLIAIALSFGLTLVWTQFVIKPQAEAEAAAQAALDAGVPDAGSTHLVQAEPDTAVVPLVDADGGVIVAEAKPVVPFREVTVMRPSTRLMFTSEGAGLTFAELLGEREREEQHLTLVEGWQRLFGKKFDAPPHVNLARVNHLPNLAFSIDGASPISRTQRYAVTEQTDSKVVFVAREGSWEITRTFSWSPSRPDGVDPFAYVMDVAVTVKNISSAPQSGELGVHAVREIETEFEEAPSMFGGIGNQASVLCRADDSVLRKTPPGKSWFSSAEPKWAEEKTGPVTFVGIDQQYFLTAIWPKDGAMNGRCVTTAKPSSREAAIYTTMSLAPGESVTKNFGAFLGPKDLAMLQKLDAAGSYAPMLEKTVDFGWWTVICRVLIVCLRFFQSLSGNWGLAIILLTISVKLLLLPLTHRAMVSAESMKKLQPHMEALRKKYPDDREKQNQEMMKLYQEQKVNPLGGCLPLILQLPIWGALFTTLRTSYELYGEPFWGVWSNLTTKDVTYILPMMLGVTMIVTQRLQPQMMDKQQAFLMTWVMPVFFTAIMMNYPSGLALYIFTNNILSIVQQYALRRHLANKEKKVAAA
jgi:YidC/Oxa1 family membrane protein insertase